MAVVIAGQLDMGALHRPRRRERRAKADLRPRQHLPLAAESGAGRLLRRLVLGGLAKGALRAGAGLALELERAALNEQRKDEQ